MKYQVCKELHFCYGHRLMNHEGPCRYLHGHNGRVEIVLEVEELNPMGMVADFGEVKKKIGGWIDQNLDHRMLLYREDPFVDLLKNVGEPVFVFDENPTAEVIAEKIFEYTKNAGFPVTEVRLWETESANAIVRKK